MGMSGNEDIKKRHTQNAYSHTLAKQLEIICTHPCSHNYTVRDTQNGPLEGLPYTNNSKEPVEDPLSDLNTITQVMLPDKRVPTFIQEQS